MSTIEVIFLTSSVLTGITGLIILGINPWRTINQTYVIATSLSALWLFSVYMAIHRGLQSESQEVLFWLRISSALASFLPWTFALAKIAITEPTSVSRAIKRSWPWFLVGCALVLIVYTEHFIPDDSTSLKRGMAYPVYVSVLSLECVLILVTAYRNLRVCTGVQLLELKFFLFNICFSTLVILTAFVTSSLLNISLLRYVGPFVIIASFGLSVWAICSYRIFDARQVLAQLARRVSTLIVLASCIIVTNRILSDFLTNTLNLLISSCIGALISVYCDKRFYSWLGLDSKQILARHRTRIIDFAREEADASRLIRKFETFLRDWCQAESVTFHTLECHDTPNSIFKSADYPRDFPYLRQTGYITTETLSRRRPDKENVASKTLLTDRKAGAIIAVPRGSHSPSCLVSFGHKHSLRPYTYPDLQLLIQLVELMDNILTQSRVATRTAQIEKMEAAAMMSRGLAHDLNNLATPVSTFLQHMEDRVKSGSAEAEVLADAKHSIRVMQDYIRESLFFASRHVPDFQSVSINELVTSTVQVTQARALDRGVPVMIGTLQDCRFSADHALIQRMLQNLVLNGIDATPRGGRVTVSGAAAENNCIIFTVMDEGPGVSPEIIDRIFEPYFTTKDTGNEIRGLGLGLAISLKISDLHGGELQVGRAPLGGAVFTVTLPATPAPPINPTTPTPKPDPQMPPRPPTPTS